jgi:ribosome biogenesis GTPase / thiamine phosphate phosphatase
LPGAVGSHRGPPLNPGAAPFAARAGFADIDVLRATCRFRDCRHLDEPGCAVRARVDVDRLRNHHKLSREMRRDSMNALQRREQLAMWKARGRADAARLKAKRGED